MTFKKKTRQELRRCICNWDHGWSVGSTLWGREEHCRNRNPARLEIAEEVWSIIMGLEFTIKDQAAARLT